MKKSLFVYGLLLGALAVSVRMEARGQNEDVEKMIRAASGVILNQSASSEQVQGALIRLLDAAILTLPQAAHTADARLNLELARVEFKKHSPLSEKAYQHLTLAYSALNAGKSFRFPEVHSIKEARAHVQNLVAASVAEHQKEKGIRTSGLLLECVIVVVTPMPR